MNGAEQSADGAMAGRDCPLNWSSLLGTGLTERPELAQPGPWPVDDLAGPHGGGPPMGYLLFVVSAHELPFQNGHSGGA